jgi:hypothetical protein
VLEQRIRVGRGAVARGRSGEMGDEEYGKRRGVLLNHNQHRCLNVVGLLVEVVFVAVGFMLVDLLR